MQQGQLLALARAEGTGRPAGVQPCNLAEIAMLAGLPQSPVHGNPIANPRRAVARQHHVLNRLLQAGASMKGEFEQRLRSVDQWEQVATLAAQSPGVLAVSPLVTGPAFAARGTANKSVVLMGVDPEAYRRIAAALNERRADRERWIEDVRALLTRELAAAAALRIAA